MIRIKEAVIVEGKYDKIKLSSFVDGLILTTDGFQIFKDKEKMNLLRELAKKRGLLILTDSDAAGFMIRNHLVGSIDKKYIKHCYIPDIFGKERRKDKSSAEGKLGVEGMPVSTLITALKNAGIQVDSEKIEHREHKCISKLDLYEAGLSGGAGSSERRRILLKAMGLPERMAVNSLVDVLNAMMNFEQYKDMIAQLFPHEDTDKNL